MTRGLKIRAWFEPTEEYKRERYSHYGNYTPNLFYNTYTDEDIFYDVSVDLSKFKAYPVVEQYTGLKDKNGKEVYEGDIIKVVNVHDGDEECWEQPYGPAIPQEVKWDEERLRWSFGGCGRILYAPEDFEVIGNIHENPELLRGAE